MTQQEEQWFDKLTDEHKKDAITKLSTPMGPSCRYV